MSVDLAYQPREADTDPLPAAVVRVVMTLTFDAYVLIPQEGDGFGEDVVETAGVTDNLGWLTNRIESEVRDAIEHHAPHLTDTEPGDAIAALVGGGSGDAVIVKHSTVDLLRIQGKTEEVTDAVEHTAAWMS